MGWKNLKEHFGIKQLVHVSSSGVHVGVPYIPQMLTLAPDGSMVLSYEPGSSSEIGKQIDSIRANPELVRTLLSTPDTFEASLPVFTFDGSSVLEKRCEAYGWPNTTHDGELMYENQYSSDRAQVIEWARREAMLSVGYYERNLAKAEAELIEAQTRLERAKAVAEEIQQKYPDSSTAQTVS